MPLRFLNALLFLLALFDRWGPLNCGALLVRLDLAACILHESRKAERQFPDSFRLPPFNGLGRNQFRAHTDCRRAT